MQRQQQSDYSLRTVPASAADFYGFEQPLLSLVRGWLYGQFSNRMNN
jgi:hypothetical protein